MNKKAKIGWVVDVQNDFMRPTEQGGRLYVHNLFDESDAGAVQIEGNIIRAVEWMDDNCDVVVFTGDWHSYDHPEIDPVNPDPAKGTYPPHCMGLSESQEEREGAYIIESIRPENPLVLSFDATTDEAREIALRAVVEKMPVFIQKHQFSVFDGNPATEHFLSALQRALDKELEIYVAGVARDVCVNQAIGGMQERGYETVAIKDATWGLGLEDETETTRRWSQGGTVVSLSELKAKKV